MIISVFHFLNITFISKLVGATSAFIEVIDRGDDMGQMVPEQIETWVLQMGTKPQNMGCELNQLIYMVATCNHFQQGVCQCRRKTAKDTNHHI